MRQFTCSNVDELNQIAQSLIDFYPNSRLFAFDGEMGAGKTTFIKQVCTCLGVEELVTSPTFSIVNEYYSDKKMVYHFDFYRLKNSQEAINLGFNECFYSGHYCLIEWPEIVKDILPANTVMVRIVTDENTNNRIITF